MTAKHSPMADVLRAAFPVKTAQQVAFESGASERTVECWLMGRYTNTADALLRIAYKNKHFRDVLIRHLSAADAEERPAKIKPASPPTDHAA